jgi:hypothetical protein
MVRDMAGHIRDHAPDGADVGSWWH